VVDGYVRLVLDSIPETQKILILDKFTTGCVAQVKGQTELFQEGVYLFNQLGRRPTEKKKSDVAHLEAVVVVRPTPQNIELLEKKPRNPEHKNYHIFFSNILPKNNGYLSRLANADTFGLVVQVKEIYLDYTPVNDDLFHFRLPNSFCLFKESSRGYQSCYDYHIQGLISLLLGSKVRPQIRYDKNSQACRNLAFDLNRAMVTEAELFAWNQPGTEPLLLILDRREDPVTPLLTQWTYQAMTHEIFTINNSRVKLPSTDKETGKATINEIVLNSFEDEFFCKKQMLNLGEIGVAVKELIESYQKRRGQHSNIDSLDDMHKFVDGYADFMNASNAASKHVGLLTEISNQVKERKLYEISAVEQDITVTQNMKKHFDEVQMHINNPKVLDQDKLRLVMLYALRYETEPNNNLPILRDMLRQNAISQEGAERVRLLDLLLNTCGTNQRRQDLFGNQSFMSRVGGFFKGVQGVDCVYTQHQPLLDSILNNILKRDLKLQDYPIVDGRLNKKSAPDTIIVFYIGGCTYEEAALVRAKSQSSRAKIILGGSCIHNSASFLEDMSLSSSYNIPSDHVSLQLDKEGLPNLI